MNLLDKIVVFIDDNIEIRCYNGAVVIARHLANQLVPLMNFIQKRDVTPRR
jgi:hypothetical protein